MGKNRMETEAEGVVGTCLRKPGNGLLPLNEKDGRRSGLGRSRPRRHPMARVKPDEIVYALSREFTKALDDTMGHFAPRVEVRRGCSFRVLQECRLQALWQMGRRARRVRGSVSNRSWGILRGYTYMCSQNSHGPGRLLVRRYRAADRRHPPFNPWA